VAKKETIAMVNCMVNYRQLCIGFSEKEGEDVRCWESNPTSGDILNECMKEELESEA
jgi:hypothetical protein